MPAPDRRRPLFGVHVAYACGLVWLFDALGAFAGLVLPVGGHVALGSTFAVLTWRIGRGLPPRRVARAALLGGLFVTSLAWWPMGTRKAFFRQVATIERGMSRAELHARFGPPLAPPYYAATFPGAANAMRPDTWRNGVNHVLVRYDETDRVSAVERFVD